MNLPFNCLLKSNEWFNSWWKWNLYQIEKTINVEWIIWIKSAIFFHLMKEILKSLWRISKWLNMISIDELNQSRRYLNFKLIWSHKFFQTDLNRNNWVNNLIHSKFNGIDWNWFIWWLNDLNEIFLIFWIWMNWNDSS